MAKTIKSDRSARSNHKDQKTQPENTTELKPEVVYIGHPVFSALTIDDADRLREITLALDGITNLLGRAGGEEDKLCVMMSHFVEDLVDINRRIKSPATDDDSNDRTDDEPETVDQVVEERYDDLDTIQTVVELLKTGRRPSAKRMRQTVKLVDYCNGVDGAGEYFDIKMAEIEAHLKGGAE